MGIYTGAMFDNYIRRTPRPQDANRNKAILDRIPEGHWGKPEDIAGGCMFLASGDPDYLNIDGGWLGR